MDKTGKGNILLVITIIALLLLGCVLTTVPVVPTASEPAIPPSAMIESPDTANANAQATIDSGQSQLLEMSRKSTEASLILAQTENASFQSTQDYDRRQQVELDFQATSISQNVTQAASTQEEIVRKTQAVLNATAEAQNRADAATQSAYWVNLTQAAQVQLDQDAQALQAVQSAATQTVQAQLVRNAQATQAVDALASMTAYPLTATPIAKTKAALLMQQYAREQQSFVDQVVAPLIPVVAVLDFFMFILAVVLIYQILEPLYPQLRIPWIHDNFSPIMRKGISEVDHRLHRIIPFEILTGRLSRLQSGRTIQVEIVNAAEPPVNYWVAEVEDQLDTEGEVNP
jgi:hypothetical protein